MNEIQELTLSGALAVLAFTCLFFGFGNDDDDEGGMMRLIYKNVS